LPAQILWLKTLINVLFSFGRAAGPADTLYNWQVWMSILLSASVLPRRNRLATARWALVAGR
jgi:hypothetical protein